MIDSEYGRKYVIRHLKFGWCFLFVFMLVGVALESMHGFKIGWYLEPGAEARRLLFTLGHAHGALFSIINILFALSLEKIDLERMMLARISVLLQLGSLLFPVGLILSGVVVFQGDPNAAIVIALLGALLLVVSFFFLAVGLLFGSRR